MPSDHEKHAGQLPEGSGADTLLAFIDLCLSLVTGPDPLRRVHVVLWAEAIAGIPEIRPSRVDWDRYFRQGITDGSVRADIDPGAASLVIVGLLRGVALQLLLDNDDAKVAPAWQAVGVLARTMLERS